MFRGRLKSGLYAVHAAATAASASVAFTSTMTTCESGSGGSRMTIAAFVVNVHPAGTLKVTPAGVARDESSLTVSEEGGAGFCATVGPTARTVNPKAMKKRRAMAI